MRAAIYLRISLDRDGDGLAIDRQREDCEKIVQHRGWELVATYDDPSISASSRTVVRPGYEQMIRDWRAGKFDAIVCWDLDRLTRQPRQLEDWIDAAETRGLHLVTANGEADLGTDAGRMFARIKAAVSRQEVDRKSARQKRAAEQRAKLGKAWGPRRPFGFEDDKVTHRPEEADAVRRIYEDFNAGVGQHDLCRRLAADGITTSTGKAWTQPALRQFLQNPRNAGLRAYRGEVVGKAAWEPIVSEAAFQAAQDRLREGGTGRGGGTGKHLLIGVARCGVCDGKMGTSYTSSGARQYSCRAGHVSRSADRVEEFVQATIMEILKRHGVRAFARRDEPEQTDLSRQADALRARQDALMVEFADGELSPDQLRVANERINERLASITAQMVASESNAALRPLIGVDNIETAWEALDIPRRRSIISALAEVRILRTVKGSKFDPASVEIRPKGQ